MGWFAKKDDQSATRKTSSSAAAARTSASKAQQQASQQQRASKAAAQQQQQQYATPRAAASLPASPTTGGLVKVQASSSGAPRTPQQTSPTSKARDAEEAANKHAPAAVERPVRDNGKDYVAHHHPEAFSQSYTGGDEESADGQNSYEEATRQNHLNSLFNGHLMKWKFEAEEGSAFIRVPAFFGALGLIVTIIVATVLEKEAFQFHAIVMGVCVLIMGLFILILDGRFLMTSPLSTRAHLRNILTRNFNMFRFVWGRGLLYIMAGVINISQMWLMTMISGAFMVAVGFVAVCVGIHASRKFAALRNSLADESFLLLVFGNYDGDGDGYLEPSEFALLLADLGMELDDRYTLKAFNVIDSDSDRRIAFDEFNHWWASGYIERGRKRYIYDDDEEDTYHRMS